MTVFFVLLVYSSQDNLHGHNSSLMKEIAEIEVSYSSGKKGEETVSNSRDAYQILLDHWNSKTIELQEEFKVLLLNNANVALGIFNMSKGGGRGTIVDIRLMLGVVLKSNSTNIIVAHNHPSGNLNPSQLDKTLTKKLKKACDFVDIKLLDHIIVTRNGYFSFNDESLL